MAPIHIQTKMHLETKSKFPSLINIAGKKTEHFIGKCCFETSPASRKLYAWRVRKGTCRYTSDLSTPEWMIPKFFLQTAPRTFQARLTRRQAASANLAGAILGAQNANSWIAGEEGWRRAVCVLAWVGRRADGRAGGENTIPICVTSLSPLRENVRAPYYIGGESVVQQSVLHDAGIYSARDWHLVSRPGDACEIGSLGWVHAIKSPSQ